MKSFKKKWLQKSITLGLLSGMCCIGVNAYAEDLSDNTVPVNEKYVVEESAAEEDVLYPLTGSYGVAKPSKVDTAGSFRPLYAPLSDPGRRQRFWILPNPLGEVGLLPEMWAKVIL